MGAAGFHAGHIAVSGAPSRDFVLLNTIILTPMRQLLRITATFALVLVFSAGMAFGQENDAEVQQIGGENDSEVEQTGSNADATILQGLTGNEDRGYLRFGDDAESVNSFARVDQDGNSDAFVIQEGPEGFGDNSATVSQTGDDHDADLEQYSLFVAPTGIPYFGAGNNKAEIIQKGGDNNSAELRQLVGENEAYITQTGSDNVFEDEVPTAFSVPGQSGSNNFLDVDQSGDANEAIVDQSASNSRTELTQENGGNFAEINMTGGFSGDGNSFTIPTNQRVFVTQAGDDEAEITQESPASGGDNYADLQQNGSGVVNEATLDQIGNANVARLEQFGGASAEVTQGEVASPAQEGNRLSGRASKTSFATQEEGSFLRLNQIGNDNWTAINQEDGRQVARLDQSSGSKADILQTGGQGTVANRLSGTAGELSFATQNNSTLNLVQNGNDNWTAIDQFSEGNTANVDQIGNGNTATITQN